MGHLVLPTDIDREREGKQMNDNRVVFKLCGFKRVMILSTTIE